MFLSNDVNVNVDVDDVVEVDASDVLLPSSR
jgi:hypothetical protein